MLISFHSPGVVNHPWAPHDLKEVSLCDMGVAHDTNYGPVSFNVPGMGGTSYVQVL